MVGNSMKGVAAGLVVVGTLALPASVSAQGYGYANDRPSVVVECGPGQRAVMVHHRSEVVARCEGAPVRGVVYDEYGRELQRRQVSYDPYPRRSTVQYIERRHRRSKAKSALMIAGSAATGAGVGGALKGKKGALVGAAIAGGAASIYDASKRR